MQEKTRKALPAHLIFHIGLALGKATGNGRCTLEFMRAMSQEMLEFAENLTDLYAEFERVNPHLKDQLEEPTKIIRGH